MKLKPFQKRLVCYLLNLFTKPKTRERVIQHAKNFEKEAVRYTSGLKGEALETKNAFGTLIRFMKREPISKAEKRVFSKQMIDLLKGTGVVLPFMLIPLPFVGTVLLVIVEQLMLSQNIKILPSAFYPKKPDELLTPEAVIQEVGKVRKVRRVRKVRKKGL
jgi:hypothetical protein